MFRKGIHVGNLSYSDVAAVVEQHLMEDVMQSVKPWLEQLIDAGTVQSSTVQYCTVQYSTVQYSTVQSCTLW